MDSGSVFKTSLSGMYNYCTLFDSFYLSRGLELYNSLKETAKEFHLYIFSFDDQTKEILNTLELEYVTIIPLDDFETPELLEVKKHRTIAEYCWTCTPSVISFVLHKFKVADCTYIDSDLCFYSDPAILIDEMIENNKTVLITEHRFSTLPKLYEQKRGGRFCVQFVTFMNEEGSLRVLDKWRMQCLEWCFSRYEDGKFGDQKYLESWPDEYSNIHILNHQGGGVAPWNTGQYKFKNENNSIIGVIKRNGINFKVVFYHFQYVKLLEKGMFDLGWYYIPANVENIFYNPYLQRISGIEKMLMNKFPRYKTGFTYFRANNFKNLLKILFKKVSGYNMIKSV